MMIYRPEILRIRFGAVNSYLIKNQDGKYLMIDAGYPGMIKSFQKQIAEAGILPQDILLILITHTHHDHIGSLAEIKDRCECKVAVHEYEADILQSGCVKIPPGTNFFTRIISGLGQKFIEGKQIIKKTEAELKLSGSLSLHSFGIDGEVVSTPGHTQGSLSVLLNKDKAFVGDLAMNVYPWSGPIYPFFGQDRQLILKSWKKLIAMNVDVIYPAHGRPFSVRKLIRKYEIMSGSTV